MYSLWWSNYIVPAYVSKVAKSIRVVCEKHNKCAQVSHIMMIWKMRKSNTLIHNHNFLMGTTTFEVHPITPTSPKITFATIFKSILILFSFFFWFSLHILFLFEHIMHGHIREREEIPNYVSLTSQFCYVEAYRCYS